MSTSTTLQLATYLLLAVSAVIAARNLLSGKKRYPPGPPARAFAGNLDDIPRGGNEWVQYRDLSQVYGRGFGGVFFRIFGNRLLVLTSFNIAHTLLDRKGAKYSSRPRMAMLKEVKRFDWNLVIMSYGRRFLAYRRIVQQEFQPSMVAETYRSVISREVAALVSRLLVDQGDIAQQFKQMAGAIIMMITYGHQVTSSKDEFVALAEAVRENSEKTPGNNLVDLFPFLKYVPAWFPGGGFHRHAAFVRQLSMNMRSAPYEAAKCRMAQGHYEASILTRLIDDVPEHADKEQLIMDCTSVIYSAGADTTVAALLNFFHAMTLYPAVQERVHHELDAVVGRSRLPTIELDRARLPYLGNIVKETLRWRAVSPLGVPHATTEDDEHNGMFIPRGTTVIADLWAMLHDEAVYSAPDEFNPDRFSPSSENPAGEPDPARVTFGFGRRICPGRFFADETLWLAIASLLQVFTISLPEGVKKDDLNVQWSSGLVSLPSEFPYVVALRFPGAQDLVSGLDV